MPRCRLSTSSLAERGSTIKPDSPLARKIALTVYCGSPHQHTRLVLAETALVIQGPQRIVSDMKASAARLPSSVAGSRARRVHRDEDAEEYSVYVSEEGRVSVTKPKLVLLFFTQYNLKQYDVMLKHQTCTESNDEQTHLQHQNTVVREVPCRQPS